MFITFEGIDGCGKTTQINLLAEKLLSTGIAHIKTREPGGTPLGQQLRALLLNPDNTAITPLTELLLFSADRAQHLHELILPSLAQGKYVLCDRYTDSTIAYQVGGRGLSLPLIQQLLFLATENNKPDITFLFDLSPEIALSRASSIKQADRFETEKINFYHRTRAKYIEIAATEPSRIVLIDAESNSAETIHNIIINRLGL